MSERSDIYEIERGLTRPFLNHSGVLEQFERRRTRSLNIRCWSVVSSSWVLGVLTRLIVLNCQVPDWEATGSIRRNENKAHPEAAIQGCARVRECGLSDCMISW